jgi:hypothetical protein
MGVKMTSIMLLVVSGWVMSLMCRSTAKINLQRRNEGMKLISSRFEIEARILCFLARDST